MKIRSPLAVALLSVVTFGFYFYYWFYKVNQEAATINRDRWARPGRSLLAASVGSILLVPLLYTLWTTAGRIGRATGEPAGFFENLLISILLAPLVVFVYAPYQQSKLNRFGRAVQARQREAALMQNVQVSVLSVQADMEPERSRG